MARLLVLGASGGVGRAVCGAAAARGWTVRAQSRDADRLAAVDAAERVAADPTDPARMADIAADCAACVFALGVDTIRRTTLFSDATRALLPALEAAGARRLVAITGVGAGETRGHGGWLYDRLIFPLFTRNRYDDKERQEELIRAGALDWTILRPAPFAARAGDGPLEAHLEIPPDLRLTNVTREEVARFAVALLEDDRFLRRAVFYGRR